MSEATTAPATTTPATTGTTSFWSYLKDFIPYHLAAIGIIGGVLAGVVLFNHYRDLVSQMKAQQAITATLQQKFMQVGTSAISANVQQPAAQVQQQASDAFGPALIQEMAKQDSKIDSLTTIVGTEDAKVSTLQSQLAAFDANTKNAATGALTGYTIEENRNPPLDSVKLFYDPTKPDPADAFRGTTWEQYQEVFHAAVGSWQEQKTGGFKTTVSLSRTISKPDPNNPGKTIVVGTEQIPITGSDEIFTPKALAASVPAAPQPRWTLDLGIGRGSGSTGGYTPAATIGYRMVGHYGLFAGTVNDGLVGGVSIQLGGNKQ